jgi:Thioredoxin like C-terminal domain
VSVAPIGLEAQADWANLESPETYLGYAQGQNFASPGGAQPDEPRSFEIPDSLRLNHWALSGDWTLESRASVVNEGPGTIAFRFHARDVNLVMGPRTRESAVPFRVMVDGESPGTGHGGDVDEMGNGTLSEQRLYQLIRQQGRIVDRTFEITFPEGGAEGYCFTFG